MNSNEHTIITDFTYKLIADFFKDLDRQGPCDEAMTRLALQHIGQLPDDAKIADIGCGTGGQTITLANNLKGAITAVDLIPEFIDALAGKVKQLEMEKRFRLVNASMDELPFSENELDLIWAEGSIYNIGYERGLNEWHKYLKTDGYIVVSEVSWLTQSQPQEIVSYWNTEYPEIAGISKKVDQMQRAGYLPLAHFVMPESSWWSYYEPIKNQMKIFLKRHSYSETAKQFVDFLKDEIAQYTTYKEHYGYVFYIGQKK